MSFELPPGRKYSDYIFTYSGQAIYPEEMKDSDIKLVDIAYGLAGIYRYNGMTRISVLRHSIALYHCASGVNEQLFALLHDAAEAYLMDIPVPKKRFMNKDWGKVYRFVEQLIFHKYRVNVSSSEESSVLAVDKRLVEYEMDSRERFEPGSQFRYPGKRSLTPDESNLLDQYYHWDLTDHQLIPLYLQAVRVLSNPQASSLQQETHQSDGEHLEN